jgi:hypothetical protein
LVKDFKIIVLKVRFYVEIPSRNDNKHYLFEGKPITTLLEIYEVFIEEGLIRF